MGPIAEFETWPARRILAWAIERYGRSFAIATSFQKEGMVIADMAWRIDPGVRVFTIDTGRLPVESHRMIQTLRERYGIEVEVVSPDPAEVRSMVAAHGVNLFRRDVPLRMLCCNVRKVRPLERKLATLAAWASGLRREQNPSRAQVPKVESSAETVKINPLADWTAAQVDAYIRAYRVPLHPLYGERFRSIGCAPCTRPVGSGEGDRDGRWWWEDEADKECGIHFTADGRARRRVDVLLDEVVAASHA